MLINDALAFVQQTLILWVFFALAGTLISVARENSESSPTSAT